MEAVSFAFGGFTLVVILLSLLSMGAFITVFVLILTRMGAQKRKNDASPRLTVQASVVAKRMQVYGDHAHTTYYATFEVHSGDRMELMVPYNEYGYLVEKDRGSLTFQGTCFIHFERTSLS